jgi:hypothetical protein
MRCKAHVRFSGEEVGVTSPPYPTAWDGAGPSAIGHRPEIPSLEVLIAPSGLGA